MSDPLRVTPSEDWTRVVVHLPSQDLNLDASGLDGLIRVLGEIRAKVQPPHPAEASNPKSLPTWIDTDIGYIDGSDRDDLLLRTAEFGWLRFQIGYLQREAIGKRMLHQGGQNKTTSAH